MSDIPRKTLKLTAPVTVAGKTIDEISYRPMVGGDMLDLPIGGDQKIGDLVNIFCKMSGQTIATFAAMDPSDLVKCVGIVSDFLGGGPQIGGSASG